MVQSLGWFLEIAVRFRGVGLIGFRVNRGLGSLVLHDLQVFRVFRGFRLYGGLGSSEVLGLLGLVFSGVGV